MVSIVVAATLTAAIWPGQSAGSYSPGATFSARINLQIAPIAAPDGSMWGLSQRRGDKETGDTRWRLHRVTPSGVETVFRLRGAKGPTDPLWPGELANIAVGADASIWCILVAEDSKSAKLIKINRRGQQRSFTVRGENTGPISLAAGPKGDLWFTGLRGTIGRMTPRGQTRFFSIPSRRVPEEILQGADGSMWGATSDAKVESGFGGPEANYTFRITRSGAMHWFKTIPSEHITLGPDGNIWLDGEFVQRLTPRGQRTNFDFGLDFYPIPIDTALVAGGMIPRPDGTIAVAAKVVDFKGSDDYIIGIAEASPSIGSLRAAWKFSRTAGASYFIDQLASGPDGMIWATGGLTGVSGIISSGLVVFTPSVETTIFPAQVKVQSARSKSGVVRAQLRCSGVAGKFCSGKVGLEIGGRTVGGKRNYAIAPLNRLYVALKGARDLRGKLTRIVVTNEDPGGTTTTVRRKIRIR